MSAYSVKLDGVDIYDPTKKEMALLNAKLHLAVGEAGYFEFTMPSGHVFYNNVVPYGSSIEVLEDGASIFFGRPLKPKIDIWGQKTYHCEGMLAFLNDSRPYVEEAYDHMTVKDFFSKLIEFHNSCQRRADRQLTIGNTSTIIGEFDCYFEVMYQDTIFDLMKKNCLETTGGYIFTRRTNGVNYIDWYKEMPYSCNQIVTFGINMLDLARNGDDDVIYTGVYGVGDAYSDDGFCTMVFIRASDEICAKYGNIIAYKEFPEADTAEKLKLACQNFLSTQQFESLQITCKAADMHFINPADEAFKIGMNVRILSDPQFLDVVLPIQSIDCSLDGQKNITIGTLKKQTLTAVQRSTDDKIGNVPIGSTIQQQIENINSMFSSDPTDGTQYQYMTGADGNDYAVYVDNNGNVVTEKIPDVMQFDTEPKSFYYVGDTFDMTGTEVIVIYKDDTWEDVTASCTFSLHLNGDFDDWVNGVSPTGYKFEKPTTGFLIAKKTICGREFKAYCGIEAIAVPEGLLAWSQVVVTTPFVPDTSTYSGRLMKEILDAYPPDYSVPLMIHFGNYASPDTYLIAFDYAPALVRARYVIGRSIQFCDANGTAYNIPYTSYLNNGSGIIISKGETSGMAIRSYANYKLP